MRNFRFHTLTACVAILGLFAGPFASRSQAAGADGGFWEYFNAGPSSDDDVWSRHFRVGALVGFNLKASFSMNGTFTLSGQGPGATGLLGLDHNYSDGFVRVDATGNDQGATYYWSYNDASQYDPALNRLSFHSANSYTANNSGSAEADPQIGFDTAYGGHLFRVKSALVGWEFGFGLLPIKIEDKLSGTASVTQITHWFDASNLGANFFIDPGNGNTLGSYTGTSEGPGAKLNDIAQPGASIPSVSGALTGTRTLDVTLYNFRLGPTIHWELHPRIAVAVSGGAAMGIVNGELKFDETINLGGGNTPNNQGRFSDTQITYGGYLAGKLMFHAVKNGDFYVGAQYMPMKSVNFSGGGREADLNLSGGIYISAGINWPF